MDQWLAEKYLSAPLLPPQGMTQALLRVGLEMMYLKERLFSYPEEEIPPETPEIATQSAELMAIHYDMPLPLFSALLGSSMKYSMGLWEQGAKTLDEAQRHMMEDVCAKAELADGQRVLDIGCGFGALATHIISRYPNTTVYGLTLSETQVAYLRDCMGQQGHPLHSDRFYLAREDFNTVQFGRKFDRVLSLGVFEHVSNLGAALEKVQRFTREDGLCFLHYIAFRPRGAMRPEPRQNAFINRYIFPGGRVWNMDALRGEGCHFELLRQWFLSGRNYRRTLQAWLRNFNRHSKGLQERGVITPRMRRVWELYLQCCIAFFSVRGGTIFGNGQFLLRPRP